MLRPDSTTLVIALPYTAGGLFIEGRTGFTGQLALGLLTTAVLGGLLALHPRAVRIQTLTLVVVATVGEVVGSLVWGLYSYRLDNLPAFVPPGHGLIFLCGISVATLSARHGRVLLGAAVVGAAGWGFAGLTVLPAKDTAGALGCAALIVVLLWTRRSLYAGVFLIVMALELYGTAIGTWRWVSTVPGLGLTQGNPPSGAASGYVVFDVVALWLVAALTSWAQRLTTAPRRWRRTVVVCTAETSGT
jgi:hypothetical protein